MKISELKDVGLTKQEIEVVLALVKHQASLLALATNCDISKTNLTMLNSIIARLEGQLNEM